MYDIAIIGAGPAGATLARLVGDRYRVLLVDKRGRHPDGDGFLAGKCCGGLLAPDAQRMLSKLGLGLPKSALEEPQLFVVKALDLRRGLQRFYQRHYINLNRRRFDGWLMSQIPATVTIQTGCRLVGHAADKNGFTLTLAQNKRQLRERARILVRADGASSGKRQHAGAAARPVEYIAIQEWVESHQHQPHFTSIFDPDITDFYCWTIPKGGHLIIGAALAPRRNSAARFGLLKLKLNQNGFAVGRTLRREGAVILRPTRLNQLTTARDGLAHVGEAGGWISPSSAEGLSYAFRSALYLAESLAPGPEGFERRYTGRMKKLKRNIALKILKSRVIFNPILRHAVMRIGLQTVRMVDDASPRNTPSR